MNTFEDYMTLAFLEENPDVLDDDIPDKYDAWLQRIPASDMYDYANIAYAELSKKLEKCLEIGKKATDELVKVRNMINPSLDEALNSGDGTYKP